MDTKFLVDIQIQDGLRLIDQLASDGFGVGVAFWVKTDEEGLWYLYIASHLVGEIRLGEAYKFVYSSMAKHPDLSVSPSDIKLISVENPMAQDTISIRDRYPARIATRYNGRRIGSMSIVKAYIYSSSSVSGVESDTKYGARVYLLNDGVAIVKQTIKRRVGQVERYVLDEQREQHVDPGDDAALGAAVRAALEGRL